MSMRRALTGVLCLTLLGCGQTGIEEGTTQDTDTDTDTGTGADTGTGTSTSTSTTEGGSAESTGAGPLHPDIPAEDQGIVCAGITCLGGEPCNICDGIPACIPLTGGRICLDGWNLDCDGPEECDASEYCVYEDHPVLGRQVYCKEAEEFVVCDALFPVVCRDDDDCPSGCEHCVPPDDLEDPPISFCRTLP